MNRVFKIIGAALVYIGVIPVLAYFIAYFSAFIVMGRDFSEEATVGIITYKGFPIWFLRTAPGISMTRSWHYDRYLLNAIVWLLILFLIAISIHIRIRKKRSSNQPPERTG